MSPALLVLVEGQSEAVGLPVLLRRVLNDIGAAELQVARPFRIKRTKVSPGGEIGRAVRQGLRARDHVAAVLVVVDSDDDNPGELEKHLLAEALSATDLPVAAIAATRELEAWFLGAKESLRGVRRIRTDASAPPDPEKIRGAKERLTRNMEPGSRYLEVDDQPAFAAVFDTALAAQRCPSFQRLLMSVERLAKATVLPET